ncbi:MAG: hypothetical protein HY908_12870 [Myxococcales bacterium]|nr:hypothetical protein [Myxococcales bacterium]
MASRKAFLLRIDPAVLEALQRWANDDLRSLNGQIEFALRRALAAAGRPVASAARAPGAGATASHAPPDEAPVAKHRARGPRG